MTDYLVKKQPGKSQAQRRAAILRERAAWKDHIRARDGHRCVYSGVPASEVHHVVYLAHGGGDVDDNGATLSTKIHADIHAGRLYMRAVYGYNRHTGEYEHVGWLFSGDREYDGKCEFRRVNV